MCLNKSSSSATTSTADTRVGAGDNNAGIVAGGSSQVTIDNSGFHGTDLQTVTDFLAAYGQGAADFSSKALDTIKNAQVNATSPGAGTAQSGIDAVKQFAWPLAVSLVAALILSTFKGKK